jgi:type IV pilus assembly protein PilC
MAKYRYSAIDDLGKRVSGVETATSAGAANLALIERGFQPLEMDEKSSILKFEITKKKVPRKDVMHFSRQLGVFVKAGIPIMEALEVIAEETNEKLLKPILFEMIEELQAGDTFASAAAAHPAAFPTFYVGLLQSAELTGNLDVVLNQLADYIERDVEARGKLTSALIYPGVVMGMSIVTVVILASFVLPRFQVFFKSLHAKLPLPTRMLLAGSAFITNWAFVMVGALVLAVVAFIATRRSDRGRAFLDGILLKLPVLGSLVQTAVLERVCRVLASMIRGGVALPEAMIVTADAANNAVYRNGINGIRDEMMQGQGLAAPLARTGLFPGAAQQMFRVGEETGTLDQQLQTAADYYNRELDVKVAHFTSLFEPAVIIFMGVVVGFVAVALISAMYGIYNQVKV